MPQSIKCSIFVPMSLYITSLNSGSNGNCYYVGNDDEAVLVDAGISCREIETRMHRLSLDIKKVKAVFVSHEHADHIKGIPVFAKKYQLPVFITPPTLRHGRLSLEKKLVHTFRGGEIIRIGSLQVIPFSKLHDAMDPYSFTVRNGSTTVGVFTDIGTPCEQLSQHFSTCDAAFLESNYDEAMLENGRYPFYLKQRIRGGLGHLSNSQALHVFNMHRPAYMTHLLLSHLSHNNNHPDLVQQMFDSHAAGVQMIVASRFSETAVYKICRHPEMDVTPQEASAVSQLSFAFE